MTSTNPSDRPRILVTGGAGYIGSHVARALDAAGFLPIVYDSMTQGRPFALGWGAFEKGDIRDESRLASVMNQWKPEGVMHFAALINVGESVRFPEKYWDNNVNGSKTLLKVMAKQGIRNLVFSSTAAVYGNPKATPISETSELVPVNPYGEGKLAIERAIGEGVTAGNLNAVAFRYFNAAGASLDARLGEAHEPETHLIPIVLERALGLRESLTLFGNDYPTLDGTCVRDYVHVEDLASAHVLGLKKLLIKNGETGAKRFDVFNLGCETGFSNLEVVRMAEKVTGTSIPFDWGPRRDGDPAALVANSSLAKATLGWSPQHLGLEPMVRSAWQWLRVRHGLTLPQKVVKNLESRVLTT
jgi:UDP-glucose-4-epimerase GalE